MSIARLVRANAAVALLGLLAAGRLDAQWAQPSRFAQRAELAAESWTLDGHRVLDVPRPTSTGALAAFGVLGGAVGLIGGAGLGYSLDRSMLHLENGDDPGLLGMIYGAVLGSSLTVPLSVHHANRSQGSLGRSLVVSLGLGVVSSLLLRPSNGYSILLAPIPQIVSSVLIETSAQ